MNTKLIAIALFTATAAAVAAYPAIEAFDAKKTITKPLVSRNPQQQHRPKVDVVFVLDTTGSMGGMIEAAKEKIWSIASTLAQARGATEIEMGLVAYRDRGDAYVTRVVDLSTDLDSLYATLMGFEAQGGGDGPESVNQALYEAVHRISWSQDDDTYKVLFLVGDAPPHMDYENDVQYPQSLAEARRRDIVVNTIQCGRTSDTEQAWQRIASLGQGEFLQVDQSGSAVALSTPYDAELATLAARLDDTRLYYGAASEQAAKQKKVAATLRLRESASLAAQARRATFNVSDSGAANQFGDGDLAADVASGRVSLDEVDESQLPPPLVEMPKAERERVVEQTLEARERLQRQIKQLSDKREAHLQERVKAAGGARESLDGKLFEVLGKQLDARGMPFSDSAPRY
ncbi:MAG: VWA domain-containing protein [Gammaproteobacteria bacterium]|nr:VWA domain-containing protein [Gammaproteobacteria bacterium]